MCKSCLGHHGELMEDHKLADPSDRKTATMPADNCERHVTEKVKMWCKGHNEALCTVCAFMDHRSCKDVIDLSTDISKVFSETDLRSTEKELKKTKKRITLLRNAEEKNKEDGFLEKNKRINMVKEFQKKSISIVENLGKTSFKEINDWYTDFQGKLNDNISMLDDLDKHIGNCLEELDPESDNKAQLFVAMKKAEKLTDKANSLTPSNPSLEKKFRIKYDIESSLTSFQSLGSFQQSIPRLYKVKDKREIRVRTTNDARACDILSTCVPSDGSIVIADYNNRKLKRINSSTLTVTDHCDLPESPLAVCLVGQYKVAVGLDHNTIAFVDVSKLMDCTRRFKIDHGCRGLAYKDGELFVHDGSGEVHVYNMLGTLLRSFNVASSSGYVQHLAIDRDRLYIACGDNGLQCTDVQGKEIYRYNGTEISRYLGVSIDGYGGVFLSGYNTRNVVQLGADGEEMGEVLTKADGLQNPQSVWFGSIKKQLIATEDSCDSIFLFDLVQ